MAELVKLANSQNKKGSPQPPDAASATPRFDIETKFFPGAALTVDSMSIDGVQTVRSITLRIHADQANKPDKLVYTVTPPDNETPTPERTKLLHDIVVAPLSELPSTTDVNTVAKMLEQQCAIFQDRFGETALHIGGFSPELFAQIHHRSMSSSFTAHVREAEQERDRTTNMKSPAYLLKSRQIREALSVVGGNDTAMISFDVMGMGIFNELGMGRELDAFIAGLEKVVRSTLSGFGRLVMSREGGDEFMVLVGLNGEGNNSEQSVKDLQKKVRDLPRTIQRLKDKHFSPFDIRVQAANELIRARFNLPDSWKDPRISPLGIYMSMTRFNPDIQLLNDENYLQTCVTLCRDLNDRHNQSTKALVKDPRTRDRAIEDMYMLHTLDEARELPMKANELEALKSLNRTFAESEAHREKGETTATPHMIRLYHQMATRKIAGREPFLEHDLYRLNRSHEIPIWEFFGHASYQSNTGFNFLVIDIKKFGKLNSLLGALGADREVVDDIILKEANNFLPQGKYFRDKGGEIIFLTDSDQEITLKMRTDFQAAVEDRLTTLVDHYISRRGDLWEDIEAKEKEYQKHKISIYQRYAELYPQSSFVAIAQDVKAKAQSQDDVKPGKIELSFGYISRHPESTVGSIIENIHKL